MSLTGRFIWQVAQPKALALKQTVGSDIAGYCKEVRALRAVVGFSSINPDDDSLRMNVLGLFKVVFGDSVPPGLPPIQTSALVVRVMGHEFGSD